MPSVVCSAAAPVPSGMRTEVRGQNGLMTGDETGFGERLRRYRITAGLTQETLAERTGLSVRGIADLERGARRFPHVDTIRRLAEALQLAPADRAALVAAGQRAGGSVERVPASPLWRTCPRCGRENALAARFCSGCGKPLELACPACGSPADPAARFCQSCGTSLAPSGASATAPAEQPAPAGATAHPTQPVSATTDGEHKLATVLFCQLANAGPLAQRLGSEGMLAFLDYFFGQAEAEVRQFEGTISSFLSDGFVALFGVPVAHEDHARRGVLAALGLQRRLKEPWSPPSASHTADPVQPALRMSLATGLVAIGHLGSGPERRATAAGETTFLAAALQQQTEPGTILISHATARMVTGYVRLEELGLLSLPGTAEPVAAFRVAGGGPRRSPLEGLGARPLSQFVGRDREVSTPHDLLAQGAASRTGAAFRSCRFWIWSARTAASRTAIRRGRSWTRCASACTKSAWTRTSTPPISFTCWASMTMVRRWHTSAPRPSKRALRTACAPGVWPGVSNGPSSLPSKTCTGSTTPRRSTSPRWWPVWPGRQSSSCAPGGRAIDRPGAIAPT